MPGLKTQSFITKTKNYASSTSTLQQNSTES